MIVPCECGAKLKLDESKIGASGAKVRCPRCGHVLQVQKPAPDPTRASAPAAPAPSPAPAPKEASGPLVLVAHDSAAVRDSIISVVAEAGFTGDTAADGHEALKKATEKKPKAIVIDVGLPGIYGFEICERLKGNQDTADVRIILLSSVYDMRRYKRTPVTLYGADDYIEKHHIPDYLPMKLRKLIYGEELAGSFDKNELPEMSRPPAREFQSSLLSDRGARPAAASDASAQAQAGRQGSPDMRESSALMPDSFSLDASIFQKEECDIPRFEDADASGVEKARRFARIIVSDIALYNQEAVDEGLKNGTFYTLLKADVDEGREIYEKRVPASIRAQKDYYQEAFDNFIEAQKKNVR